MSESVLFDVADENGGCIRYLRVALMVNGFSLMVMMSVDYDAVGYSDALSRGRFVILLLQPISHLHRGGHDVGAEGDGDAALPQTRRRRR